MTMVNDDEALDASLDDVLAEVTFPAEKWDVTTCADFRGVSTELRRRLYDLPCRTFEDAADVEAAL